MIITAIGLCIIFSVNPVIAQSWTKDEIITNALEKTNAVSVNDSKKNNKGVIFLDVRTRNEYLAGNIPGSVHFWLGLKLLFLSAIQNFSEYILQEKIKPFIKSYTLSVI